ncbi:MAG TPA: ribonuclease III [Woeseiaceae bacterium]|nr:ribonuclease III [Woeseiaceae bacterium]
MEKAAAWLKRSLDYEFRDVELLRQALTHRSAAGPDNERLEYLGDAVLDVVVSEVVFRLMPMAGEGVLSRIRSSLVKDTTLAALATELDIGQHLILGPGEKRSGVYRRSSVLADALEAIFGAVYLDTGFEEARHVIQKAYGERLLELPESASRRDPKSRLQELLQSKQLERPSYNVEAVSGQAHRQSFEVSCRIGTLDTVTIGRGRTRRQAEQEAAMKMLVLVEESP